MKGYLDSPIRDVIDRYPEVGTILDEYGVGCVTCGVGTCPVKDIISIHHLPPADEQAVMSRIATVIERGGGAGATKRTVSPGPAPRTGPRASAGARPDVAAGTGLRYSPPLKQLVDEHAVIKRWLALIPTVVATLDLDSAADRQLVLDGVGFIRSYADRLHHAKEEDILFKYYDADRPIIKIMLDDHEQGRTHARATEEGLRAGDRDKVAEHLLAYRDLLAEHIKKEDEILYPWMDRDLSTNQVGELFGRFAEVDAQMVEISARNLEFVERAERYVREKKEREAA